MKMNDLLVELNVKKTAALLNPDIKFNKAAAALDPAAASAARKATASTRKTARDKALERERNARITDIKRDYFPTMDKLTVKQKNELRLRIQQELDSTKSVMSAAERKSLKDALTDNKLSRWFADNPKTAKAIIGAELATVVGLGTLLATDKSADGPKAVAPTNPELDALDASMAAFDKEQKERRARLNSPDGRGNLPAPAPETKKGDAVVQPPPITDQDVAPKKSSMSGRRPDLQADASPVPAAATNTRSSAPPPEAAPVSAKSVAPKQSFSKEVTALAKANKLENPNNLKVGQTIKLPGDREYTVVAGDNLYNISAGKFKGAEPLSTSSSANLGSGGAGDGEVKGGIKTGTSLLNRSPSTGLDKGSTDSDEDKAFRARWREDAMARLLKQIDDMDSKPAPRTPEELESDELWKDIRAHSAGKSEAEIRAAAEDAMRYFDEKYPNNSTGALKDLDTVKVDRSEVVPGPDLTAPDIEMRGADLSDYVAPVTVDVDERTRLERQRRMDALESINILKLAGLKPITERDFTQGIIKVKPLQTLTESTELNECGAMGVTTPTNASLSISASASTGEEVASMLQSIMTLAGLKPVTQDMMPMASDPMPMVKAMDIVANPDMLGSAEEPTSFEIDSDGNGESDIEVDIVDADSLNAQPEEEEDEGEEKKADEGFEDATTRPNPQSLPGKGYGDLEDNTNKRRNFRYTPPGSGSNPLMKPRTMGESVDSVTADLFRAYESFKNGQ